MRKYSRFWDLFSKMSKVTLNPYICIINTCIYGWKYVVCDLGLIEGEERERESVNFILKFVLKGRREERARIFTEGGWVKVWQPLYCVTEFWRFIVDRHQTILFRWHIYTNRYCHSRDEVINLSPGYYRLLGNDP